MESCMQDTVRLILNSTMSSQKKNVGYTAVSHNGEPPFFSLLVMTLCIVLNVIIMEFMELYYNHKRKSLEEMYEKAISKSREKRSSA